MKTGIPIAAAGLLSLLLCLPLAGCARNTQAESPAPPQDTVANSRPKDTQPSHEESSPAGQTTDTTDANLPPVPMDEPVAEATPVLPPEKPEPAPAAAPPALPEHLNFSPATLELVKLARAAVPESVMLAYVTNSTRTFNLLADHIVYLNDLGVSSEVIRAMIEQDRRLRELGGQLPPLTAQAPATNTTPPESESPVAAAPQFAPTTTNAPAEPAPEITAAAPTTNTNVTYQYFYEALSPYGTWVYVDGYGYCWQPSVVILQPGWRPYCHGGRWIYTDYGWYWHSDYTWGWATFHYGRWFLHPRWGWCWWPDTVWAPAWVTWRYHPGYCGWAPLPPYGHFSGFGFAYSSYGFGWSWFTFVSWDRFHDRHLHRHRVKDDDCRRLVRESRAVKDGLVRERDRIVNRGIDPDRVREHTGREMRPLRVRPQPVDTAQPASLVAAKERYEPARGEVVVPRLRPADLTAARAPGAGRPERAPAPPAAALPTAGSGAVALRGSTGAVRESLAPTRSAAPVARARLAENRARPADTESNIPARPERTPELAAQGAPEPRPTAPRPVLERPATAPGSATARGTDAPAPRSEASTPAVPARPVTPRPESRATYTWTRPAPAVPQAPAAAPQPSPVMQPRPAPAPAPTPRPTPPAPAPQSPSQNVIVIRPSTPPGFNAPAAHPWGRGGDSASRYRVFSSPPARQVSPAQAPAPSPALGGVPAPALTPPSRPMAPPPSFQRPAPAPAAPPAAVRPAPTPSFRPAPATPPAPAPSAPGRGAAAPGRSRSER